MGTGILVIAFVIEAAFTAYCIITKSNQKKGRSFLRISAFAGFVLFTLVAVIEWTARWYGLAALLLVWAVLGAWTLIHSKTDKNEYQGRRIVSQSVAMLLLVIIAVIPALIFPQYQAIETTGEYQVSALLKAHPKP